MSKTCVMLLFVYILGVAMPSFAGVANPRGPEERPVTERTFRVVGNTHDALVTLAFPTPDRTIDRFVNGVYGRSSRFVGAFFAEFGYEGFFWQGRFGTVDLALDRISRPQGTPIWRDLGAVVAWLKKDADAHNLSQTQMFLGQLENRMVWTEPLVASLNGVPCIRQEIRRGNNRSNDSWVYYFLIDQDNLVEVDVRMTDNSDRPGLAKSNWHPRAVAFREKLLSAIKVNVVPTLAAQ